jgi:hypothetical protein
MDSESVSTWKRNLEIQGFGRSAEHVLSAGASRSAEARRQENKMMEKEKIMKEIIII